MQEENKYLHIEGIASKKILRQLIDERKLAKQNTEWFFVSYSPVEYKLNTKFDIILAGEEKKMLPRIFNIKLLDVIQQTGKHLDAIPRGWKTICRFEFKPAMPAVVRELPALSSWSFIGKIKFARHEDLIVDPFNLSKAVYTEVIKDFIDVSVHTNTINTKNKIDFLDTLSKVIHSNSNEMRNKIPDSDFIEEVKKQALHTS